MTCLVQGHLTGKETGLFLTSHSLKQRTVHKVSRFSPNSFSMDNCRSPACTDSIKVFLGNPPKDSAQWTTQLFIHCLGMISLNKRDWFCFSLFCDMDLTLLSTTRMQLAFFILLAAKFYSLGFVCALNGQDSWCSAWRREYSRGSLKHPCNT